LLTAVSVVVESIRISPMAVSKDSAINAVSRAIPDSVLFRALSFLNDCLFIDILILPEIMFPETSITLEKENISSTGFEACVKFCRTQTINER
jgi:hypothetical protein